MKYENILVEQRDNVGLITLHRPKALNALCEALMDELTHAIEKFDADDSIGCMVLTGSEKAFAAGADIKEMSDKTYIEVMREDFISANWEAAARARKPIIAAVAGYALGGGCELAMMCDFILAGENAKFGPAGDKFGRHSRCRRHAATDAFCRQVKSHGNVSDRADDGCARSRALRVGVAHYR